MSSERPVRVFQSVMLGLVLSLSSSLVLADSEHQGPVLEVANPSPGDMLTPGAMVIQGVAFDDNAEQGTGVDRVSVFIGDRDQGASRFLGDATLGLHNPQGIEHGDQQFAQAGWSLRTPPLPGGGQDRELVVYARSSVSGREAVVVIPVTLGETGSVGTVGNGEDGGGGGGGGED